MNREIAKDITLSLAIILSQLLIFNHMNLFGTENTFIYVSLFILYKTTYDKTYLILFGFLVWSKLYITVSNDKGYTTNKQSNIFLSYHIYSFINLFFINLF